MQPAASFEQEPLADVIQMSDRRNTERINGIRINLGSMSLTELTTLEGYCGQREVEARTDGMIVRDYIDTHFPSGPEVA